MDTTSVDRGGAGHSSVKTYITGFILALTLTAIPFALVKFGGLSKGVILTVLFTAAICQMLVHLHYFFETGHLVGKTLECACTYLHRHHYFHHGRRKYLDHGESALQYATVNNHGESGPP